MNTVKKNCENQFVKREELLKELDKEIAKRSLLDTLQKMMKLKIADFRVEEDKEEHTLWYSLYVNESIEGFNWRSVVDALKLNALLHFKNAFEKLPNFQKNQFFNQNYQFQIDVYGFRFKDGHCPFGESAYEFIDGLTLVKYAGDKLMFLSEI